MMCHRSTSLLIALVMVPQAQPAVADMTNNHTVTEDWVPQVPQDGASFQIKQISQEVKEKCEVLSGGFAIAVQGVLFISCLAVLYLKFKKETSNRTWHEFLLDSSKQLAGAAWIHVMNLVLATYLHSRGDVPGDQCEWYWVNIMIDTTLGVFIEYCVLWMLTSLLVGVLQQHDFNSGEYRDPITQKVSKAKYVKQLVIWLIVVGTMKVAILWIMLTFTYLLHDIAHGALTAVPALSSPKVKLVVVMVLTPTFMNAFQFYIVDHFIKGREHMLGEKAGSAGFEPLLPN